MSEEQKAATPLPEDGNTEVEQDLTDAPGTSDEEVPGTLQEDEPEKPRTDWKALALSHEAKVREFNRLEQEKRELEERLRLQQESPTPAQMTQRDAQMAKLQKDLQDLQTLADQGVPGALTQLVTLQELYAGKMEQEFQRQLLGVPDQQERMVVERIIRENPGRFTSVEDARIFLDGLRARYQANKPKEEPTEEETAQPKLTTSPRAVVASEVRARKFSSEDAFDNHLNNLRQQGREDEAWKLMKERSKGNVIVGS